MSDYLGLIQTRVLDSDNRSFESVTYQRGKPPLSCEKNLAGKLASVHSADVMRSITPSGFTMIGSLKEEISEGSCNVGDILTSSSFTANTFKLIALNKGEDSKNLIAWVNGWPLLIQGSNSLTENNTIILPSPPTIGYRIDFVFLEVWRKLIDVDDIIYKHGNVLYGGTNPANDLIDPAIGLETTRRIQIQYRIRVAPTDLENYPSGFDPTQVFVQGPLDEPLETCSHAYFSQVPGDPGLWRAGAGDSAAQEDLLTVDGYTYAIPMFAVARRNTGNYDPDNRSNAASKSLSDYLAGTASDRPDNLYNDWIVANDILDMRHRISPECNMTEMCNLAFQKLITGKLRGKMAKTTLGEDHFGTVLVQADAVSNVDKNGSDRINQGDNVRRVFANAEISQSNSLIQKTTLDKTTGTPGNPWTSGDAVQITAAGYPTGSVIVTVDEVYTSAGTVLTPTTDYVVTNENTALVTISIPGTSSILASSVALRIDYTINFAAGTGGLTDVPETFLEIRKEDSTSSIATQDSDIRVRLAGPVVASDGTHYNVLSNQGGPVTEQYNFGHQMIYHKLGEGSATFDIKRVIDGYTILGIAKISIAGVVQNIVNIHRDTNRYYVTISTPVSANTDIECTLYTETKFFTMNKQGRAVLDTFEMTELTPLETATGSLNTFTLDSTNKQILALGSNSTYAGAGIAYVDGVMTKLSTTNYQFPTDTTKSMATIEFPSNPGAGALIEIPVLMRSAISDSEGYTFFYHKVPYQGLLDSTTVGTIEATGTALTTTAGSGSIVNYTYSEGTVKFTRNSTDIVGTGTKWASYIKSGYEITLDSTSNKSYIISNVLNDTQIQLSSPAEENSPAIGETYTIKAPDQSEAMANVIDRLPTYNDDNDGLAKNENISTAVTDGNPVLETRIISRPQDMVQLQPGNVIFGVNTADRGRTTIHMDSTEAPLGLNNLGLRFEKLDSTGEYQKTFQSYILNKENKGNLYLMVIGSETDNTGASRFFSEFSNNDSVDIFELPGRPLLKRRTQ